MSVAAPPAPTTTPEPDLQPRARRRTGRPARIALHAVVVVLMIVWFTPVLGLFVTSIRTQTDVASSGWWNAFVDHLLTGYNYQQAMQVMEVGSSTATSLAISIPVTVLTTVLSAVGAYDIQACNLSLEQLQRIGDVPLFEIIALEGGDRAGQLFFRGGTVPDHDYVVHRRD